MTSFLKLNVQSDENKEDLAGIQAQSGLNPNKCYQCGKCSAGCPVAFAMDKTPREIVRMLQLGMLDDVLKSKTIWLCAGCQTCSARCPMQVDLAAVMESLRVLAKKKGYINERQMDIFHDAFLKSVERYGRVHEMGLILGCNIIGKTPFKDVQYGLPMLLKGKLKPLPHTIKDNGEVKKIFENVRKRGMPS